MGEREVDRGRGREREGNTESQWEPVV